ncbi:hypothetical protein CYFUS_009407 [Cystobacter fuscus]|uniref:DUF4126 domain-containing protein n=1 Tax=Cystobacter fuscus TaxID=43 RepID=A0A250JLC0_9BACT|nr:DUF4126 family protein [Cystobacter fuscus]ATB43926.1 hypothetical protein CYFUS_009407 [Cystobacter fuscus]
MNRSDMMTAAGMGAMAGMRALGAPAFLSQHLAEEGASAKANPVEQFLASSTTARVLPVLALGELVLDKLPGMPSRVVPPVLLMRLASGALVGAAVARQKERSVLGFAVVGAATALVTSFALYTVRQFALRKLHIPNIVAGFLEDALVASVGHRLTAVMG